MIIRGNPAGNVGFWSKHLQRDDTNERATVMEISGLLAEDLTTALREMQAVAAGSRSQGNFMYQANINPQAYEKLTPEQWKEAVDTLEKNLGLTGHQRVVVEHEKEGRTHRHVIWNRVDAETLRVADIGGNYRIHTATQQELEARFDLTPTPEPSPDRKRPLDLWEVRAAERSGIDPDFIRAELSQLWRMADTGKAFAAAVEERGYILARGDRRDFCIVDHAGDAHSLARRLEGVKVKDVRERMADIDRDSLPTVAEARATQRDGAQARAEPSPTPQLATEQPKDIWEAWRNKDAARQAETGQEKQPAPGLGKAAGEIRLAWTLSKSGESFAAALDERGLILARVDSAEAADSERLRAFAKAVGNYAPRYAEGEIVVVNNFGDVQRLNQRTTGQNRNEINKRLATLDPASFPTVGAAQDKQQERHHQAGHDRREALKKLRGADRADNATLRREDNKNHWEARHEKDAETQKQWRKDVEAERARAPDRSAPSEKSPFHVVNAVGGFAQSLGDFVGGLLAGDSGKPRPDPATVNEMEQIRAERRARAAIERMADSLARGQGFKPEDIQSLTPNHLENIKARGDAYVIELVRRAERERERYNDYGRERER